MSVTLSQVVRELKELTFSPLREPGSLANLIKIPMWGTLGTGGLAIISGVFKGIVQERVWRTVSCNVFEASLTSCATCATVVAFSIYKLMREDRSERAETLDDNLGNAITSFEAGISLASFFTATLAFFVRNFSNHPRSLLAKHSIYPFIYVGSTALSLWAIRTLHARNSSSQHEKDEETTIRPLE